MWSGRVRVRVRVSVSVSVSGSVSVSVSVSLSAWGEEGRSGHEINLLQSRNNIAGR